MVEERYNRNIGVWTEEFQEKLMSTTIGVAGLGGVGGTLIDILARNGIGTFKIADPDVFDKTNLQRQISATEQTIGVNKTVATKERIHSINPGIKVISYERGIEFQNLDDFLNGCDFVHEGMDYFISELKIEFHRKARGKGIISTTSAIIGAGAFAIAFHPQKMSFEEYFEYPGTSKGWHLPPNKLVLRYPDYFDTNFFFQRVSQGQVPTTADGGYLTGVMIAGLYKRILMGKDVNYAPKSMRMDIMDDMMYKQYAFEP